MRLFYILFLLLVSNPSFAQCVSWRGFDLVGEDFTNPAFGIALTVERDRLDRPFLYLAQANGGVKIYSTSKPEELELVATIWVEAFEDLDAINLSQVDTLLYVTLGNLWNEDQSSGLAIINVADPSVPVVLDYYTLPGSGGGAGAVKIVGDLAYLAAMDNGLLILDITNKMDIQLVSQLMFDLEFPHTQQGGEQLYNARGIDVQGDVAYVCLDRGGLRIVDLSSKSMPIQIGQYVFDSLIDHATAYNNIVVSGDKAYVTIDYYGVEILDISDPINITQLGWWHPADWSSATNDLIKWATAVGHANEIVLDSLNERIFIAAGKSDVVAISIEDPRNPITCDVFGTPEDKYGTWGLDFFQGHVDVAYIWSPIAPPVSNFTGIRSLSVDTTTTSTETQSYEDYVIGVYPNPVVDKINIDLKNVVKEIHVEMYDLVGGLVNHWVFKDTDGLTLKAPGPAGTYLLVLRQEGRTSSHKVFVNASAN